MEFFTFEEFARRFEWSEVNPVGPIFDVKKLDWLNGVHIRSLDLDDFTSRLLPFLEADGVLPPDPSLGELARLKQVAELIQTRIAHLTEATDLVAPFYVADDAVDVAEDARAQLTADAGQALDAAVQALEGVPDERDGLLGSVGSWRTEAIEEALRAALVDGLGLKPKFAFGPLRTAISGRRVSPPLFESIEILGRESTLARLRALRSTL